MEIKIIIIIRQFWGVELGSFGLCESHLKKSILTKAVLYTRQELFCDISYSKHAHTHLTKPLEWSDGRPRHDAASAVCINSPIHHHISSVDRGPQPLLQL